MTDRASASKTASAVSPKRRVGMVLVVAAIAIAIDQATKWWAVERLSDETIPLLWTLRLNLADNTGAAFSVGRGTEWGRYLPILALVVVGAVIWRGQIASTKLGAVSIGMIMGGAIGNLLDRGLRTNGGPFFSGGVVDFIDLQWWPIFNIADSCVVVGGILLVAVSMRVPHDAQPPDERPLDEDPSGGHGIAGRPDRADSDA